MKFITLLLLITPLGLSAFEKEQNAIQTEEANEIAFQLTPTPVLAKPATVKKKSFSHLKPEIIRTRKTIKNKSVTHKIVEKIPTQKTQTRKASFKFSEIFTNEKAFTQFVVQMVSVIEINSTNEVSNFLQQATQGTPVQSMVSNSPLLTEFLFHLFKRPEAIAQALALFIQPKTIVLFLFGILLTMILSHYLGEFKFKYPAMSYKRISYSIFRFSTVNGLRLWIFAFLFSSYLKPVSEVFITSVHSVQDSYPILFKVSTTMASLIS